MEISSNHNSSICPRKLLHMLRKRDITRPSARMSAAHFRLNCSNAFFRFRVVSVRTLCARRIFHAICENVHAMEFCKVEIARRVIIIAAIAIGNTVAELLCRSSLRNSLGVHIIFAPEHTHTLAQSERLSQTLRLSLRICGCHRYTSFRRALLRLCLACANSGKI